MIEIVDAGGDEALLPLTVNCWPSISGADAYINIEYECGAPFDLRDVVIAVPAAGPPRVNAVDGDWRYDAKRRAILWTIDLIDDSNRSGSAEFVVPAAPVDAFFPVDVSFVADATLAGVRVLSVTGVDDGEGVKHGLRARLAAEEYQVV